MNPEITEDSLVETVRQKADRATEAVQGYAQDTFSHLEDYARKYPWLVVGGALAAGVALAAILPRPERRPDRLHAVRDWLGDAYDRVSDQLPDKSDVQSMVQSCQVPAGLKDLGRKLHLW